MKDKSKFEEDSHWETSAHLWESAAEFWKDTAQSWIAEADKLEKKLETYEKLEKKLVGLYPEHSETPFICSYDKKGSPPEYLIVCPAYGSDATYYYTLKSLHTQQGG